MTTLAQAALAFAFTFLPYATAFADAKSRPPNIIFVLADDLGYGDLGCYGQKQIQTPNLDRLAKEGMRFTQFYAGSTVCAPSRCVLMTGLHLGHCVIRGNGKDDLRPGDVTVAEVLKSAGYATALCGKWGLGHEGSTGVPTQQGFDYFFGYLDQHHAHNYYPHFLVRNQERVTLANVVPGPGQYGEGVASRKVEYSHDLILAEALQFIDRSHDRPFFLYLALTIPHANNEARDRGMEVPDYGPYAAKDWPEQEKGFAAMVSRMDGDIERLIARLKKHRIDEETLVLFSSDNGPHREGGHNPDYFTSRGPLRGIKRDLYEGGIRVPFIARWPGKVKAGSESDHIGYFGDFLATAAELAGVQAPQENDSISFAPTLLGRPQDQRQHRYLYWEFYERGSAQAVRLGDWKAVCQPFDGPVQLYNLKADLGETKDVADRHPEIVQLIRGALAAAHVPSPRWKVKVHQPKNEPAKSKRKGNP